MASPVAIKRLRKEFAMLEKAPVPDAIAFPLEDNILEWHFLLRGSKDSDYMGGYFHGKVVFTRDYPMKPPAIYFITPSGRFETNKKICMSMSDFHPETWNPMWSVGSIITGIISFMNSEELTTGGMLKSSPERKIFAQRSHHFNRSNGAYRKLFCPDLPSLTAKEISEISMDGLNSDIEVGLFEAADEKISVNQAALVAAENRNKAVDKAATPQPPVAPAVSQTQIAGKNSSSSGSGGVDICLSKSQKKRLKEKEKKKKQQLVQGEPTIDVSPDSDQLVKGEEGGQSTVVGSVPVDFLKCSVADT